MTSSPEAVVLDSPSMQARMTSLTCSWSPSPDASTRYRTFGSLVRESSGWSKVSTISVRSAEKLIACRLPRQVESPRAWSHLPVARSNTDGTPASPGAAGVRRAAGEALAPRRQPLAESEVRKHRHREHCADGDGPAAPFDHEHRESYAARRVAELTRQLRPPDPPEAGDLEGFG